MTEFADGEIEFHFEKAGSFRVIHVDGVFGGLSPGNRMIHMAVFSERSPIPKHVVHSVSNGVLGPEILAKREGRLGVFREMEADLVMTLDVAVALREWLDQKITEASVQNEAITGRS